MDIILYFFIFLMGITFGSFFTLAVYRIPLKQDITHTRSYCPNCNHRLSFFDMIPVLSYIFLGGKCKYCHKKIRIRYLLLEIFSGLVFVLFALSIKLNILNLNTSILVYFLFGLLYIAGLFIIAGIDKEKIKIESGVLLYVIIVETLYIIYLYILENVNIYRYVIYLFVLLMLILLNNVYYKKKIKNNYTIQILMIVISMLLFTYETCTILTITLTLLEIAIYLIIRNIPKIKSKRIKVDYEKIKQNNIPIGFFLSVSNILTLIITNTIIFYRG